MPDQGRRTSWDDLTPEQQYRRNMLAIAALMGLFVVALVAVYGLALLTLWVVG